MGTLVQHELFPDETGISVEELESHLRNGDGRRLDLRLTRNRVSMITVVFPSTDRVRVRLHEGFLKAPRRVLDALRRYMAARDGEAWKEVSDFARGIVGNRTRPARRTAIETAGKVYDLREIRNEVNREFFNGRVSCRIEWGRRRDGGGGGRKSRSVRFGSWDADRGVVRVHPLLDDARVPRDFVRYIVFHEMLHVVVPDVRSGGRRCYHSPTFKALERSFPGRDAMRRLAVELVGRLA